MTAAAIRLQRLALARFRNHESSELDLDGRHVCLFGPNGAGKTNLLEALSLFCPGRGIRGADLNELQAASVPASGGMGWAMRLDFNHGGVDRRIGMGLEFGDGGRSRRIVRIDGAPATQADVAELFRIIWLTPSMDRVFAGSAGDRRRFFDRLVLAHAPSHGTAASAYERAMRQRNALLEEGGADPAWLDALEQQMGKAGAAMAESRVMALQRMQAAIDARPEGAFPKADLSLDGQAEARAGSEGREAAYEWLLSAYRLARRRDAAAGRTLDGPHRTDFLVRHRPKNQPAEQCSTGEQKALLMGLILANAGSLGGRDFAPSPLLLLDEAVAHLDSARRAALYDELAALDGKAWLTGTDRSLFDAFGDRAQRFSVFDGRVQEA